MPLIISIILMSARVEEIVVSRRPRFVDIGSLDKPYQEGIQEW